jgi:hypothetical protein
VRPFSFGQHRLARAATYQGKIMNRRFIAVAMAVLITDFFGALSPLYADLNAGLVAYYPFNGNANDASGNGLDGVVYGATLDTDRFGNSNACYAFAGTGNWIQADLGPSYFNAEFTFGVWVKFDDFESSYPMIVSGNGSCINWSGMGPAYSASMQHHIYFYQPSHPWGAGVQLGGMLSPMALDVHRWYHLCVTRNGPEFAMFVDGVLSSQNTDTNVIQLSGSFLQFGNNLPGIGIDGNGSSYFHGNLDDIRIYNRALTASEVVQLYNTENGSSGPWITTQPTGQSAQAGANVALNVAASGTPSLHYQWRFNSQNIAGATSATLPLTSITAASSGGYSVVVWNAAGSIVSATASLAVLTDGANGDNPTQISVPAAPTQPAGVNNLVLVTHGWEPLGPFADVSWITDMANAIQTKAPNWTVIPFNWMGAAWFPDPDLTLVSGAALGTLYAKLRLEPQHWQNIHFIAHSAGSAVIEAMAKELMSSPNPPESIQETFLDPYTGYNLTGREIYGVNADWADDYFVVDYETDFLPVAGGWAPGSTSGQLEWAYNVDVGGTLQVTTPIPFFVGSGIAGSTTAYVATSPSPSHDSPIDFYMSTITGTANSCAAGYGFPLSIEDGGSGTWASHSLNNPPLALCGQVSLSQNQQPVRSDAPFVFSMTPYGTSSSGVSFLGSGGASLTSDAPAWLAVGVTVTNAVNFIQFDAGFTDTNAAQGLLTVYWNTNQVGMVDERVAPAGLQTYRFALPGAVTSGLYTLTFRLDSFDNSSSMAVTNVATGFVGMTQPITLGISRTNGAPLLQLTAAINFTYLIQSSTNLVDWTPTALLLNTNGTAQFIDFAVTNSSARFYRAVMP